MINQQDIIITTNLVRINNGAYSLSSYFVFPEEDK